MIPKDRYYSQSYMDKEIERLWPKVWLLACHVSDLPRAGSFQTLTIGREPILLVRETADRVRAFFNVCQHRGNVLCTAERGDATRFQCSYHHWEYGLNGATTATPGSTLGTKQLCELACESRFGFVWIRLSRESGESIDEFLAPIAPSLQTRDANIYVLKNETTIEVAANWKTSVDVNNESYHLTALHPELREYVNQDEIEIELRGPHSEMHIPLRDGSASKHQLYVFPNVQLNFSGVELEIYRHRPHPTDPERAFFDDQMYVRREHRPPVVARRRFQLGEPHELGPVMGADVDLLPKLQMGMRSTGFAGLELTEQESCIANMHRWLDRYVG